MYIEILNKTCAHVLHISDHIFEHIQIRRCTEQRSDCSKNSTFFLLQELKKKLQADQYAKLQEALQVSRNRAKMSRVYADVGL